MAKRSKKNVSKKLAAGLFGFPDRSLLSMCWATSKRASSAKHAKVILSSIKGEGPSQRVVEEEGGVVVHLSPFNSADIETDARLSVSEMQRVRDAAGHVLLTLERLDVTDVELEMDLPQDLLEAAITGLEMGLYRFKRVSKGEAPSIRIWIKNHEGTLKLADIQSGVRAGQAVNLARHLVNLPPNLLNPVSYASALKQWFASKAGLRVEVWDERRLAAERMNLHAAVGSGSSTPPRLVRISYRARGYKGASIALVGKGVTFDSGGLDIKPAAGMRLMKKDMGGSAAVVGVMDWAVRSGAPIALEAYLPLAENAIGGAAFRPSDVLMSRSGQTVEIHNTDAEGRLVLADSLTLALEGKTPPKALINVATLTGAIKVALGSAIAGLFTNDRELATALSLAGQESGDLMWEMPLYQKYRSSLHSTFADMINSPDGFGGAITAALFLNKFVRSDVPWAHLDIYAWKDSSEGALLEAGGSGQSVLGLIRYLQGR